MDAIVWEGRVLLAIGALLLILHDRNGLRADLHPPARRWRVLRMACAAVLVAVEAATVLAALATAPSSIEPRVTAIQVLSWIGGAGLLGMAIASAALRAAAPLASRPRE